MRGVVGRGQRGRGGRGGDGGSGRKEGGAGSRKCMCVCVRA